MKSTIQVNKEGKLPNGLRLAGLNISAVDGGQVPLYLFRLPDGLEHGDDRCASRRLRHGDG